MDPFELALSLKNKKKHKKKKNNTDTTIEESKTGQDISKNDINKEKVNNEAMIVKIEKDPINDSIEKSKMNQRKQKKVSFEE